jgi:hypothetical protein
MTKAVVLEILKRSGWLAAGLALAGAGSIFAAQGNTFEVLIAVVVTPVEGVLAKVAALVVRERGNVTVAEVDAEFDATPKG